MSEPLAQPAQHEPVRPPPWHGWVVADLFLSSLAAGIFTVAGLARLIAPGAFAGLTRIAYLIVFPLTLADLGCLIADLGDPARFHHMLRTFKATSPMSLGVWSISLFSVFAFVCFVMAARGFALGVPLTAIGVVGIAPALVVGGYKGVLLSGTAQPAWREARWLGATFSLSSGTLGLAALILIATGRGAMAELAAMRPALAAVLVLYGASLMLPRTPLNRRLLTLGVGVGAPFLLTFGSIPVGPAIAAGLVLIGAAAFRIQLVALVHPP